MAAPEGNQFWKARSSHGRNPVFNNPDVLWDACFQYFEWVDNHPLKEAKLFHYQGEVIEESVDKMRAMTVAGLCIFIGITLETWTQYRTKDGFSDVCKTVDEIIKQQKFEGAAADLLNPSIIARDLGMIDKQTVDVTSAGKPMNNWNMIPVQGNPTAPVEPEEDGE